MGWVKAARVWRSWFGERHIVSYTVIAANVTGMAFGIRQLLKESEIERKREEINQALAALDRVGAFGNSRLPERSILALENYQFAINSAQEATKETRRNWSDIWIDRRCLLDPMAAEMVRS